MAIHPVVNPRSVLQASLLAACACAALFMIQCDAGGGAVVVHEPLPYAQDALAPVIGAETMALHHDKHYAGYVDKANALIKGGRYAGKTLEGVIREAANDPAQAAVFNNAAQAWNHAFFFKCMQPEGGGEPEGALAEMIESAFGTFAEFKRLFLTAAKEQFGSGWVWLVLDDGKLAVISSANADTPIAHGMTPLFCVDVWEHAYYLDYQNRRAAFVEAVLDKLANWDFAAAQLEKTLPAKAS